MLAHLGNDEVLLESDLSEDDLAHGKINGSPFEAKWKPCGPSLDSSEPFWDKFDEPAAAEWFEEAKVFCNANPLSRKDPGIAEADMISLQTLFGCGRDLRRVVASTFNPYDGPFFFCGLVPRGTPITVIVTAESAGFGHREEGTQPGRSHFVGCVNPRHLSSDLEKCERCGISLNVACKGFVCLDCGLILCFSCNMDVGLMDWLVSEGRRISVGEDHELFHMMEPLECLEPGACPCSSLVSVSTVQAPISASHSYSIMHAKIMVLVFDSHVRLVISSFNLSLRRQWHNYSDVFWIQDVPLRSGNMGPPPLFVRQLTEFLSAMGAIEEGELLLGLEADWSVLDPQTYLVASVPVDLQHACPSIQSFGLDSLSDAIRAAEQRDGLNLQQSTPFYCEAFSLGAAFSDLDWPKRMERAVGARSRTLRIILNVHGMLYANLLVLRERGSLCCLQPERLKNCWHSKVMYRVEEHSGDQPSWSGWIYYGSHNISKASWHARGGLWELGVLVTRRECTRRFFVPSDIHHLGAIPFHKIPLILRVNQELIGYYRCVFGVGKWLDGGRFHLNFSSEKGAISRTHYLRFEEPGVFGVREAPVGRLLLLTIIVVPNAQKARMQFWIERWAVAQALS